MDTKKYKLYNALYNKYIKVKVKEIKKIVEVKNKVNNIGY